MKLCVGRNELDVSFGEGERKSGKSIGLVIGRSRFNSQLDPYGFLFLSKAYIKFVSAYTELHNKPQTRPFCLHRCPAFEACCRIYYGNLSHHVQKGVYKL